MNSTSVNVDRKTGSDLRLGTSRARFRKILIGMDFSRPAITALNVAVSLAEKFGGRLLLVHAVPPAIYGPGVALVTPELLDVDLDNARAEMNRIISSVNSGADPLQSDRELCGGDGPYRGGGAYTRG